MSRLNRVIELLEAGEIVFGCMLQNGNYDDIRTVADGDHDFLVLEMEHSGFDLTMLGHSFDAVLNRRRIAESGSVAPAVVPLVRVPAYGREGNQWIVKQALDRGVYGIVAPQINTVDEARSIVAAMRYPRPADPTQASLPGTRGWGPKHAARYWGVSLADYLEQADLWPVAPDGNTLLFVLCETAVAVRNLPVILRSIPGISAVWAGVGDLTVSLGYGRDQTAHPVVVEAVQKILRTCLDAGVPCGIIADVASVEQRIEEGYRIIFATPRLQSDALNLGRRVAGR